MKVALAVLLGRELEDAVNELAWKAHCRFGLGLGCRRIPPHVSLKQPFRVGDDVASIDRMMPVFESFAGQILPEPIDFGELHSWETIFQFGAGPYEWLAPVHHRLNAMLALHLEDPSAPYDGDAYRFHLAAAIGTASVDVFQSAAAAFAHVHLPPAVPEHLGVFVYDNDENPGAGDYLCYRCLQLKAR